MLDYVSTNTMNEEDQIIMRNEDEDLQIGVTCHFKIPEKVFHELEDLKRAKGYTHRCRMYSKILELGLAAINYQTIILEEESRDYKIALGRGY